MTVCSLGGYTTYKEPKVHSDKVSWSMGTYNTHMIAISIGVIIGLHYECVGTRAWPRHTIIYYKTMLYLPSMSIWNSSNYRD